MTTQPTKSTNKNTWIIAAIFLLFSAPFITSWYLLTFTEIGRGDASPSHGELIKPSIQVKNLALFNPVTGEFSGKLHGKWSLLYLAEDSCTDNCRQGLYKLRQIRLATGKHAHRVQRVLAVFSEQLPGYIADDLVQEYRGQLLVMADKITRTHAEQEDTYFDREQVYKKRIYLVDPQGNLVLSYPAEVDPKGIIKDLKRLLKYSRIG